MERESGGDTGRLREETKVKVKQKKSALLPGLITVLMMPLFRESVMIRSA